MPRYKGTCGCYNRQDARELGLVPAIIWNDMLDRSEHFNINPMWYDQKDAAERLGIEYHRLNRSIQVLVDAGRIKIKGGLRPDSNTRTTWVTILEDESEISNSNSRNEQNVHFRNEQNEISILKETKENDTDTGIANSETDRIKPAQLYSRVHSFFGGRHDRRKAMIESIEKLQEDLSDETILLGCQEIAAHPTFRTKDGEEVTWTLSMLLLRDRDGLSKTADIILKAADKKDARDKKAEKKKMVQYSTEECY